MVTELLEKLKMQKDIEKQTAEIYSNMARLFPARNSKAIKEIIADLKCHQRDLDEVIRIIKSEKGVSTKIKVFDNAVETRLDGFLEKFTSVLCLVDLEDYAAVSKGVVDYLVTGKKKKCVYISMNKIERHLRKMLTDDEVDGDSVSIVSCSFTEALSSKSNSGVSPKSLTNLAIEIAKKVGDKKNAFIFFDPLTALSVYHDTRQIERFVSFLNGYAAEKDFGIVWIALKGSSSDSLNERAAILCEKAVYF